MTIITRYLNSFENYKPLPPEKINLLIADAKNGDRHAIQQIVCSHQKFIIHTAKKFGFICRNITEEKLMDLILAGNVGLIESINRFNNKRNVPFLACAEFGIRNALQKNFHESRAGSYLPVNKLKLLTSIKKIISDLENNLSEADAFNHVSERTGLCMDEIKEILSWDSQETSLESDSENHRDPADVFSYTHFHSIDDAIENNSLQELLRKAFKNLDNRQSFIITKHFGIDCEKMSLTEIGNILQLSKQRVAQLEKQGFTILRNCDAAPMLYDYVA